jgi:hypothetical protein
METLDLFVKGHLNLLNGSCDEAVVCFSPVRKRSI